MKVRRHRDCAEITKERILRDRLPSSPGMGRPSPSPAPTGMYTVALDGSRAAEAARSPAGQGGRLLPGRPASGVLGGQVRSPVQDLRGAGRRHRCQATPPAGDGPARSPRPPRRPGWRLLPARLHARWKAGPFLPRILAPKCVGGFRRKASGKSRSSMAPLASSPVTPSSTTHSTGGRCLRPRHQDSKQSVQVRRVVDPRPTVCS